MINKKLAEYLDISKIQATKIEMSILFLLVEANKINRTIYKNYVLKFMSFLEWKMAQKYGEHFFRTDFIALENGPVPGSFMDYIDNNPNCKFNYFMCKNININNNNSKTKIFYLKDLNSEKFINLDYFSDVEKPLLKEAVNWIFSFNKVGELSEDTHLKMKSWKQAWTKAQQEGKKSIIFDFALDISKNEDDETYEIIKLYKELGYKKNGN